MGFLNNVRARLSSLLGKSPAAGATATENTTVEAPTWLIIGLGNPGTKYATTRHNIGYWVIDALLEEHGTSLKPAGRTPAHIAHVRIADQPVALVRSTTYMNESGLAVGPLAQQWNIPAERIIVVHDEMDIAAGLVRIKHRGGEGGHNGLRSISAELTTQQYLRVRLGIGRPPQGTSVIDYVLSSFTEAEREHVERAVTHGADAVRLVITEGIDKARNDIHTRDRAS